MEVLFAGIRVRELEPAVEWYRLLFGRAPDIVPNDDEVMWRVADSAWLYVVRDPERAGNGVVTICVTNLDETVTDLAGRGICLGPIHAVGDAARKAKGQDPDGNSVDVIEVHRQ